MKIDLRKTLTAGMVAGLAATLGCTGSDSVTAPPGEIVVSMASPQGAGPQFESVSIFVPQIGFRPLGEGASQVWGSDPIAAIPSGLGGVTIDMAQEAATFAGSTPIPPGTYQASFFRWDYAGSRPLLLDLDPVLPSDPCNPANCVDHVLARPSLEGALPPSTGELTPPFPFGDSPDDVDIVALGFVFHAPPGEGVVLTLNFDGPGLAQLFKSKFQCRCTGTCGSAPGVPAPCLSTYIKPTDAEIASYISFE
jgi:hypothetical protein